jgi:hypothetical protein
MKKISFPLVLLMFFASASFGQGKAPKKPSKMWYRTTPVELNDVKMEFEDEGLQGISDKKQKTILDESVTIVKSSRVKNVSEIELEQNK